MSLPCEFFHHYLPVNDEAMHWGLYVTGAGRAHILAQQVYPPPGHPSLYRFDWRRGRTLPEFQILLITDGRGVFVRLGVADGCTVFVGRGVSVGDGVLVATWPRYPVSGDDLPLQPEALDAVTQ